MKKYLVVISYDEDHDNPNINIVKAKSASDAEDKVWEFYHALDEDALEDEIAYMENWRDQDTFTNVILLTDIKQI